MLRLFASTLGVIAPQSATEHARRLLDRARTENIGILHVYGLPGDVFSVGRFHRIPAAPAGGIRLVRRLSGGRSMPSGSGFIGLYLALPHRSALVADEPARLAPEQVLNRAVRGLLAALEGFGAEAYYPGRDVVTVGGRVVAGLTFETRDDGATLVEVVLAVGRSYAEVVHFADRADPGGLIPVEMMLPERATSLVEVLGAPPPMKVVAEAVGRGYAARLGVEVVAAPPAPTSDPEASDDDWLAAGVLPIGLDRRASTRGVLGVVEVDVRVEAAHVADVRVSGDVIAPSGTIARIEAALRGAALRSDLLRERVRRVVDGQRDFVLGVANPDVLADLVLEAARS